MNKGMKTCTVCGRDFALLVEDHYVTTESEKIGLSVLAGEAPGLHDAIDCPHCGCQQILGKRERVWQPDIILVKEGEEEEEDE